MKRTFCLLATMAITASLESNAEAKSLSLIQRIRLDYIEGYIEEAATREKLEPALLRAIIRVESNFNYRAVSRVGARGLMQIMPFTAKELGNKKALDHRNPRANILAGAHYVRSLINRFGGNLRLAIAAYNAGPAAVRKHNGIPPFTETRNYVSRVMGQLTEERQLIASSDR